MDFSRTLAREVCQELGIEWDEQSLVPTVRGVPAPTPEELFSRFSEEPKPKKKRMEINAVQETKACC